MARTGFYPGSFDPLTIGHMDIITRAASFLDRLVIAVGVHHGKKPLFTIEDRVEMLKAEVLEAGKIAGIQIDVQTFGNLATDAARDADANVIIRGLRDSGDFDYEIQMAGMNPHMQRLNRSRLKEYHRYNIHPLGGRLLPKELFQPLAFLL
jgi:pantetheine-phosphate adenylyltransferase